jgi:hypothetical protein
MDGALDCLIYKTRCPDCSPIKPSLHCDTNLGPRTYMANGNDSMVGRVGRGNILFLSVHTITHSLSLTLAPISWVILGYEDSHISVFLSLSSQALLAVLLLVNFLLFARLVALKSRG